MFEYLRKKLFDFRSGFIIRKAYDYIEYNFIAGNICNKNGYVKTEHINKLHNYHKKIWGKKSLKLNSFQRRIRRYTKKHGHRNFGYYMETLCKNNNFK